jgi:hypothetical protein
MKTAQRMVDEAAKKAGYDTVYVYYRGDSAPYNVLKTAAELEDGEGDDDHGNLGNGLYFTPDRTYAERFARNGVLRKFYLKSDMADLEDPDTRSLLMAIKEELEDEYGDFSRDELYSRLMEDTGTNGIKAKGVGGFSGGVAREAIVQESWQAKLADPITYDDDGNIIPLSERFNEDNPDIRYSITPEEDEEYMQAAQAGDEATTERMVEEAAKRAGYTIKAYHGTTNDFTKFSREEQGRNHNGYLEYGGGFYFTPNENEAREWVRRGRSGQSGKTEPKVMSVYLNPGRIIKADDPIDAADMLIDMGVYKADAYFITNRTYRFIDYLAEEK